MITLMTGRNVTKIVWNCEKVTGRVQKALYRVVMAAMNWRLLTFVFTGKDKTMRGKIKCSTHI
jgi:hypothetical protein